MLPVERVDDLGSRQHGTQNVETHQLIVIDVVLFTRDHLSTVFSFTSMRLLLLLLLLMTMMMMMLTHLHGVVQRRGAVMVRQRDVGATNVQELNQFHMTVNCRTKRIKRSFGFIFEKPTFLPELLHSTV